MKKTALNLATGLLAAVATLLAAVMTIFALYDLSTRGSNPPKHLESDFYGMVDPLRDLTNEESRLSISVHLAGDEIRNLRVLQTTLTNKGSSPILPADIIEPLTLNSLRGWQIVNIVNSHDLPSTVPLMWQRVSATQYSARPALLNPGDQVRVTLYLSYPQNSPPDSNSESQVAEWHGRVVNLDRIEPAPDFLAEISAREGPIMVTLWFWPLLFFFFSFVVYFLLSIYLLDRGKLIRKGRVASYSYICGCAIMNMCASEAGATYLFGSSPILYMPAQHLVNAPPIILNALLLVILMIYSRKQNGVHPVKTDQG